jgi:hypothetical protein
VEYAGTPAGDAAAYYPRDLNTSMPVARLASLVPRIDVIELRGYGLLSYTCKSKRPVGISSHAGKKLVRNKPRLAIYSPIGGPGTMPREKSGYYYPNKFARITIEAMEEIMGKNGLNAILNLAGLENLIDNYPAG